MLNTTAIKRRIQEHIDGDEYVSAISLLAELIDSPDVDDQSRIWALRLRAHCYSWCAGMDEAAAACSQEQSPQEPGADKQVELALCDLDRVLATPSLDRQTRVEVLFERITELRWLERYEEAVKDCGRILDTPSIELNAKLNAFYTRADLYLCLDNTAAAIDDLCAILADEGIAPSTRAETLEFRADVLAQTGEIYKALDDLEVAMDIFKSMEYACGIKRIAEKIHTFSSMI
jgi:tetratricopeptide (TPR) repeat protein